MIPNENIAGKTAVFCCENKWLKSGSRIVLFIKEKGSDVEVVLYDDVEVGSNNVLSHNVIISFTSTTESFDTQNYCHHPFYYLS